MKKEKKVEERGMTFRQITSRSCSEEKKGSVRRNALAENDREKTTTEG